MSYILFAVFFVTGTLRDRALAQNTITFGSNAVVSSTYSDTGYSCCVPRENCPCSNTGIDIRIVNGNSNCPAGQVCCCSSSSGNLVDSSCGVRKIPVSAHPQGQASYGAYPWQAALLTTNNVYVGSGVLITPNHVLTVAHKVASYTNGGLKVRLGEWDEQSTSETYPYQEYSIKQISIHSQFNSANLQNDVAVITLNSTVPISSSPNINTACLPTGIPAASTRCWVSGWGKDAFGTNGKYQSITKEVDVPIVDQSTCENALRQTRLGRSFMLNKNSFICAGGEQGKDACTGDGGSPLVCQFGNNQWQVVGIVAWGIGCATSNIPGVYVNVYNYIPWITQQITQNLKSSEEQVDDMDANADDDGTHSELEYPENRQNNVEEDYSEENTDETSISTESTFDLTLPATHSYLGHNLEELRGRTILDDGLYVNLPLLVKQSVMLFPGQTLPMTVFDAQTIDMIRTCIENDRTLGVVCLGYDRMVPIGTTAEIYECMYDPDQGFRLKAKGRQRFKILRVIIQGYDKISARVQILPEITLGPPFLDERIASLDHIRIHPKNEEDFKKQEKVENLDAAVTPWPAWVYRQYDPLRLSLKIRQRLQFIESKGSSIPEDPSDLSFWVAQNLLLDDNERIVLLNYDCAISRLQREIKYLVEDKIFVCCNCDSYIGKQSHMFPMSKEGPQGTYCNPSGIIHETVTLYHAQGLALSDNPPSINYTWFPGYAWTVATCKSCGDHMGWKFTAVQNNLKPKAFWGLIRKSLKNKEK